MAEDDDPTDAQPVPFPFSRVTPQHTLGGFRELGTTQLAQQLGLHEWQLNGHWCSRCQGIWYGYTLETECPACGNRHG
jgi:hypothetical protein